MNKLLSIIIPTTLVSKNLKILQENFELIKQSNFSNKLEIILVIDREVKNFQKVCRKIKGKNGDFIIIFQQPNQGPAKARNLGIRKAEGKIILFLNDDILIDKNLILTHLTLHKKYPDENIAILGKVIWHKGLVKTPLLDYLEESGSQFDFKNLKDQSETNFRHFYTGNISVKKSFLMKNGLFNDKFRFPAYEDTELGYRLSKDKLKIIYSKKAVGYHYHKQTLGSLKQRMLMIGKSAKVLITLHPELLNKVITDYIPTGVKNRYIITKPFVILGNKFKIKKILYPYFSYLCQKWFLEGYNQTS